MNYGWYNPKFWFADPNNGNASVRKISGYVCVWMLISITWSVFFGDPATRPDWVTISTFLGVALGGCGIYAASTPSRQKTENGG